ncbi:SET domain-containing protein 3 [Didymella pomorum]|uniref:SET domain-containing protein 3 n=1 Tax=Didymella pomorum TaxID=749634 RepID=A0A9W9D9P1_9PLEO|nr:SET domain-containing protein 3 [Didymella pomorum]
MTDVSSIQAHADPQPAPAAFYGAGPPLPAYSLGSPGLDGAADEEESSTIKCICGFADDDGNTVLCEKCDTWQHIVCYYESAEHVPDVHECTDCSPRLVDSRRAADKQRQRKELLSLTDRKGRPKTTSKNPKKRTKDPLGSAQPNGWQTNSNNDLHYNPERKSGSPRDLPPPNKRPKTNHRPSGSISIVSQAPALAPASRKRGGSVVVNGNSPVKSPITIDGPIEDFSLEFMNLYTSPEPSSADNNSYTSLGVASDIAMWLQDPDALAAASGGKKPQDLFSRIENTIQDLESSTAPIILKQTEVDSGITAHGLHPQWQFITTDSPIADGGYIGELKGLVGRREEYCQDPENRWNLLRHPEPFVFFPPHLPIYIDTRQEGNILRYARRSCSPNMTMKILVDASSDYHFCFVATRQIEPTEELTVGWDIDSEVQKQLVKVVTNGAKDGFRRIQPWVSCVLANFGGCACDTSTGHECLLERARRPIAEPTQPSKAKSKKLKKSQISPLSTGRATNSRAGSETLHRDNADDDNMDSRSTSGSHKSSSRDITPATHFSLDGDVKMSDRERRKLLQQEKLFEQMEDEQHKGKRGKRNSAGSTLNTPSIATSKRLGHPDPSPSARHREHSHGVARKTFGSSSKTKARSTPKPKPVYVEASTQTEDDGAPANTRTEMKPPVSFKRKLLQQAQEDKLQRERMRSASIKMEGRSPALKDVTSNKPSPLPPSPPLEDSSAMDIMLDPASVPRPKELTPAKEASPAPNADVDMADAYENAAPKVDEPKVEEMPDAPAAETTKDVAQSSMHPPAPPMPTTSPARQSPTPSADGSMKSIDMKVEMPARPEYTNPFPKDSESTSSVTGTPSLESTLALASPFSPAVQEAVNPTPVRKKLSLSEFASRRAKLAQTTSTSGTPPLASQLTSSPTLSAASLPTASPPSKTAELSLPVVTEEPQPIQTVAAAATAPTPT